GPQPSHVVARRAPRVRESAARRRNEHANLRRETRRNSEARDRRAGEYGLPRDVLVARRQAPALPPVSNLRAGGLDLVEETVALPARTLSILRPRSAEALLDEEAFEHEEFLPYWAELWASGEALARAVAGRDVTGRRVLELGCGLALPSFAAVLGGAQVLATDWSPDAIELARGH